MSILAGVAQAGPLIRTGGQREPYGMDSIAFDGLCLSPGLVTLLYVDGLACGVKLLTCQPAVLAVDSHRTQSQQRGGRSPRVNTTLITI